MKYYPNKEFVQANVISWKYHELLDIKPNSYRYTIQKPIWHINKCIKVVFHSTKKNMRNKIKKILEDYKGKNIAFNVDGEKQ